jgi:uncharacterized protein
MKDKKNDIISRIKRGEISGEQADIIKRELKMPKRIEKSVFIPENQTSQDQLYEFSDSDIFLSFNPENAAVQLFTLDELLEKDAQREKDGFPKRIRIGKFIKPVKGKKEKIVVVPTTSEPKFYHDNSISEDEEDSMGGAGEGEEGEVIGEQQAEPQEGEGEGEGAGKGDGAEHDIGSDAFDLGKVLTEKFQLPNLKPKGKKLSTTKFTYDLTDINRGSGQYLDKKATLKRIVETNIMLGRIKPGEDYDLTNIIINPKDKVFRIMSREKDFEAQAVVFFIRDYSGSMMGEPTEAVVTQHLFIYSWLMYQYQNQVDVRFVLHDTEAKQVEDFYTYYKSNVAGGTNVYPAYQMVADIIEKEQLHIDNNIYVFHGTDGDDWEETGKQAIEAVKRFIDKINRMGITVARNSWGSAERQTTIEKYLDTSGLLKENKELIRLDSFAAKEGNEARIIEGIRKLMEE